jgi:excisionase family DNA binding protein
LCYRLPINRLLSARHAGVLAPRAPAGQGTGGDQPVLAGNTYVFCAFCVFVIDSPLGGEDVTVINADILAQARELARDLRRQGREGDAGVVDALLRAAGEAGDAPRYLTTGEIGHRLGVSRQTVVNWIKKGMLPGVRLGGRLMVPAAVMERFARLEKILDDLDAEREPGEPGEIVELVGRGREDWAWAGEEE